MLPNRGNCIQNIRLPFRETHSHPTGPARVTLLVSSELISWTIILVYWMLEDSLAAIYGGGVAGRWTPPIPIPITNT